MDHFPPFLSFLPAATTILPARQLPRPAIHQKIDRDLPASLNSPSRFQRAPTSTHVPVSRRCDPARRLLGRSPAGCSAQEIHGGAEWDLSAWNTTANIDAGYIPKSFLCRHGRQITDDTHLQKSMPALDKALRQLCWENRRWTRCFKHPCERRIASSQISKE